MSGINAEGMVDVRSGGLMEDRRTWGRRPSEERPSVVPAVPPWRLSAPVAVPPSSSTPTEGC